MHTKTLYRPVGLTELQLIADADYRRFPPRLDWQPIFYPVLNEAYATRIAHEWNTEDSFSGYCGIVLRFEVDATYIQQYEIMNVGDETHNELWVPAERLEEFNDHITDKIVPVSVYTGSNLVMPDDERITELLSALIKQ